MKMIIVLDTLYIFDVKFFKAVQID